VYISVNCSNGGCWVSVGGMAECCQVHVSHSALLHIAMVRAGILPEPVGYLLCK